MSHLAAFLQNYMETQELSQRELARRLNLEVSHVSRLASGQRKGLDEETIGRMVKGIGPDPRLKAELLKAYLWDQCPENAKHLVQIMVPSRSGGRVRDSSAAPADPVADLASCLRQLPAPSRLVKTLKHLAQGAAAHPEFQKLLEQLAKLDLRKN